MTLIRPVELVARALFAGVVADAAERTGYMSSMTFDRAGDKAQEVYLASAKAVLTELRRHGFINEHCLELIHLEEDANGEARSSVIPGGKTP